MTMHDSGRIFEFVLCMLPQSILHRKNIVQSKISDNFVLTSCTGCTIKKCWVYNCHFPKLHFLSFLKALWLVWNNQEWKCRAFTIHSNLGQTILLHTGYNPIFLQKKSKADFEDDVLRLFPWDEIKTLLHHIVALVLLDDILKMDFLLKLTNYVAI